MWWLILFCVVNVKTFGVKASDDIGFSLANSVCSLTQFQCANKACIPLAWVCDGQPECTDGSDESIDVCKDSRTCTSTEFRCKTGRCIPSSWRCDNEKDCSDGSDEDPTSCTTQRTCPEHKFVCATGHCIPAAWKCDDTADCADGSDEHHCGKDVPEDPGLACTQGMDLLQKTSTSCKDSMRI